MTAPLPGRPIRSNAPQTLEKFHVYILLVLGIALVGGAFIVIGFATLSPSAVGLGAGALATAGLIAVFFAVAGSRLNIEEESVPTDDTPIVPLTLDPDPENRRPAWPPRTSPKIPD